MSEIQLTDTAQYTPEIITNLTSFAYLTQTQKIILVAMIEGMTSDLSYTDVDIATKSGVSTKSVQNCRHNAHFLDCLSQATKQLAKSRTPETVNAIRKAINKGSVRAMDLMLRYTGDYVQKNQVETKSQNLNISANIGTGDAIEEFVALLSDKGMSLERIIDAVTTAYHSLREQQRVM
jgi:hypothetical protein